MPTRHVLRRRERHGKPLLIGLCASAGIHFGLLMWPVATRQDLGTEAHDWRPTRVPEATVLLRPAPVAEPPAMASPLEPRLLEEPVQVDERRIADSAARATSASRDPEEAPATLLSPIFMDLRLWDRSHPLSAPTALDLEIDAGRYHMGRSYDSVSTMPTATPGASSWMTRDGWGFSPGMVRLGSVAIPTCGAGEAILMDCGFGIAPNRRDAFADRRWQSEEIARQVRRSILESVWQQRARAMRARRDAERDTLPPSPPR